MAPLLLVLALALALGSHLRLRGRVWSDAPTGEETFWDLCRPLRFGIADPTAHDLVPLPAPPWACRADRGR